MSVRPLRSTRVLTGALLLGAVGAALAPAGPDALVPFRVLAASAAEQVYVAVVVDFGNGQTTSHCVPVPAGASDEQALSEVYQVAANDSGLICAINNVPSSGTGQCLETNGAGQFYYWSYWHGSGGTWKYASVGPAEYTTSSGDVEGWRFQNPGPDNASAPAPEATPSYASICGAAISPTPTVPTTSPSPTLTPTTGAAAHPARVVAGPAGVAASAAAATATTSTTPTTLAGSGSPAGPVPSATKASPMGRAGHGAAVLASGTVRSPGPGGTPLWATALVIAVIAVLGGLSYVRWRRRPAEE